MARTFALAMTRPHENLGITQPIGRRLPHGLLGWNMIVAALTLVAGTLYVVQMTASSTKGFRLNKAARQVETLKTQVVALEDQVATQSSIQAITQRAEQYGYVTVDRLEFVNAMQNGVAVAR